jgi:ABC-type Fe3+-siderophore transport system permease subunit
MVIMKNDAGGGANTVGGHLRRLASPAVCLATLGMAFIVLDLVVLGRWVAAGPEPVRVDVDAVPTYVKVWAWIIQGLIVVSLVYTVARVVRGSWRENRLTVDAAIAIAAITLVAQDPLFNVTPNPNLRYNPYFLNLSTWGPWIPGWHGSHPEQQPEPVLLAFAYLTTLPIVWVIISVMGKIRERRPRIGTLAFVLAGSAFAMVFDFVLEIFVIHIGGYTYPHAIGWLSLFPGTWRQICLTAGLIVILYMAIVALMLRTDADGRTFVERGSTARTGLGQASVRVLAVVGYLNLACLVVMISFDVTSALWAGPIPADTPSFFQLR